MTPSLAVPPLIEVRNPSFAHSYRQGMHWIRFEQNDHHGPFSDSDVVETLKHFLQTGIFDEEREITLYESLGSYFGRLHGAVLSKQGRLQNGVSTLVQIEHQDFRNGYHAGREFFFLEAEGQQERTISDHAVVEWLRDVFHDTSRSQDPEGVLYFCVGCLIGRLSGHVFSWTQEEHHRCEHDCIQELGYICALSKTCLVAVMGIPTLPLLGEQS